MSYDEKKDDLIKLFEYQKEKGTLLFSVMKYADGEPKLQISRMYEKRSGETGYTSPGRLAVDELEFLKNNLDEIIELMENK